MLCSARWLALVPVLLPLALSADQGASSVTFDDGTVAIYCATMDQDEVPERVFNAAFPGWISDLQGYADEGKVLRVHYLPRFRSGVFIVVAGDDLDEARTNAKTILAKHSKVLEDAWAASEASPPPDDPCELIEIGPVALLPR